MHQLLVLYPRPVDTEAFSTYYTQHHLPLAAQLPGLLAMRHSLDVSPTPEGEAPYFAVFEADFPDRETFAAAMASPQGQAVAADVPHYATGGAIVLDLAITEGA